MSEIVTVEQPSGKDAYGNPTYTVFLQDFAQVEDKLGGEGLINAQNKRVSTAKTVFTFRLGKKTANILPTMRIVWKGLHHDILTPSVFSADRNYIRIEAVRRY